MKIHLDPTIMQSKTVSKLVEVIEDLSIETKRLSRGSSKGSESTKLLIKKANYIINVRQKELARVQNLKKRGSLNNYYSNDF
tara:strand:- start:999 stop:1244 length:246 start_codon:yes stop_codon:yes gene_type:complete